MITLSSLPRAFVHIDCDAFFASVEQALHPQYRGKPVVTGKERGIASAVSYEAKAFGVRRGMRIFEVRQICPDAVCLPSDYETYSLYSKRFFEILRRFTPDVEEYSIDEAFCELSGLRRLYHCSYEEIAYRMKETAERELGITVSAGLSLTKSLAKICSKQSKPAGFVCVKGYQLHRFLEEIPTERVCGFGPSSVALLAKHGVATVLEYISRPETFAAKLLGKPGVELWHELRGRTVYPIVKESKANTHSISKTKTFTPPSDAKDFVRAQLLRNLESAFIKLRRHGLRCGALGACLTDAEFRSSGLNAHLTRATASTSEVLPALSELFERLFDSDVKYRRTGIVLSLLEVDREVQHDLFEDTCRIGKLRRIARLTDRVNGLYGKHALHLGSTDCLRNFAQHLGRRGDIAARKQDLLTGENLRQRLGIPLWDLKNI